MTFSKQLLGQAATLVDSDRPGLSGILDAGGIFAAAVGGIEFHPAVFRSYAFDTDAVGFQFFSEPAYEFFAGGSVRVQAAEPRGFETNTMRHRGTFVVPMVGRHEPLFNQNYDERNEKERRNGALIMWECSY